ncbi:1-(5-phosphoribosyl)-5-[(5-phosphoribosylamino)methylideneamino]imidazole-4-carboxamide isomerase [Helicobacter sp. 13S00401-1]|uniref:1-(5-phosphoribosyl)-5-[(5- phosphoribosylamino)methylideneamino]imidazole-4- carboxamide isomerase n=1 Tax=Helicobacter sp. 13S00401-1 TaxID=1905758 RepID=UPI000BA7BCFC|nr:1-(5-phosphoribosyl)-5-[(5-phosphoribosylamino)methylideneamino]imidazole-4-carboxamide isomerase [Helicobacter sp. 13S00401-1]PAF51685.1 1-(5-phosphoribosyl)-5-[(5-phosphoribosylamino)methylideneamino]imidazole-4-carboxamide isomerase [Helicobacter sp. 13S00401-1]
MRKVPLEIFPAIDILDSKAVRLSKGEKSSAKIYGEPLEFAKFFKDCNANWVHIVDLDAAFSGTVTNLETIKSIVKETGLKVQVGGGIRDEDAIKRYIDIGVSRVILGSVALKDPSFAKKMAENYPVAIGIDAKDGKVATHGWVETSTTTALDFARSFKDSKVSAIICTDVSKDGLLSGVNIDYTKAIASNSGIFTIASGGFKDVSDIDKLALCEDIGGVIIGRAFYEGNIDLRSIKFR